MLLNRIFLPRRFLNSISSRTGFSLRRPELDFDFLLNEANIQSLRNNIKNRKGVGDIDCVHQIWREIQNCINGTTVKSENDYRDLWDKLYEEASLIPNQSHPDVPLGDESCARLVKLFGTKRPHSPQLLTAEKILSGWRAVLYPREACGSRSYSFIGPAAALEESILSYVWAFVIENDFKPVLVSDIVKQSITAACGLQKRSDKDIQYKLIDQEDLCLSGTAEMGLCNFIMDRTFHEHELPLKLTSLSRCYRPEISGSAKEARLYRVHEFSKIEMFVVCKEEESDSVLNELIKIQCSIFQQLELHFRLLEMPSEELGAPAHRKYDVEAWMPGRNIYGEISSASNCTDYQARRLNIKYIDEHGNSRFVHTCNATAVATNRVIIALLENLQKEHKGLHPLPSVLRQRMPSKRPAVIRMHDSSNEYNINISELCS